MSEWQNASLHGYTEYDEPMTERITCGQCWRHTAPEDPCWILEEACLGPEPAMPILEGADFTVRSNYYETDDGGVTWREKEINLGNV